MLLKFLLIAGLIGFLLFRVLGLFFRVLTGSTANHKTQGYQHSRKPKDGNVNVDFIPNKDKTKNNGYKGGEYVDYEELD
ncbi:MAG: DUF4834 domain-containing protein [Bacteroidota bacterium]